MRAGTLKYPIQIWQCTVTYNEYNEQESAYENYFSTRANITSESGQRTNENNEVFYTQLLTFEVRRYVPVNDFDRIKYNNKFYRIISIHDAEDNMQHMQMKRIVCELINE